MKKVAIIKKLPDSGKYRLYSHKKDSHGKRRNLGTFDSYEAAKKHEGDVNFFKGHAADDQEAHDKETKALKSISDVAKYLESAGYTKHADELYAAMDSFGCFDDAAMDGIPDNQMNYENQSALSNTGFSQGTFNSMEATIASLANRFDKLGLFYEADVLDEILKEAAENELQEQEEIAKNCGTLEFEDLIKRPYERVISELYHAKDPEYEEWEAELQHLSKIHYEAVKNRQANEANNIDALVDSNGKGEMTALNNGPQGGLSDSYFYQSYQNLDQRYKISP